MPDFTFNDVEVNVLRRALKALRHKMANNIRKNERLGWKPEEGKLDLNVATMQKADELLARFPYTNYAVEIENEENQS
jgi:hypothetical protein